LAGEIVHEAREALAWTQGRVIEEMVARFGRHKAISVAHLSRIEHGEVKRLNFEVLMRLLQILGIEWAHRLLDKVQQRDKEGLWERLPAGLTAAPLPPASVPLPVQAQALPARAMAVGLRIRDTRCPTPMGRLGGCVADVRCEVG
jgi:transcriptional regulator with XRE-family HTH domain